MRLLPAFCAAVLLTTALPAAAAEITGTWLNETGASRMRVARCRGGLCGTIVWLREPTRDVNNPAARLRGRSLLGVRLFSGMQRTGPGEWRGRAYVPGDGSTHAGRMSMDGAKLQAVACVLSMCTGNLWTRVR
jgi:uncharacterized protein (DUF2147 family)